MTKKKSKDVGELMCPYCQKQLNHALQTSGGDDRKPRPNDTSICGSCLNVSQFSLTDDGIFHLVEFDVDTLDEEVREKILAQVQAVRQHHASFRLH